jgi:hypothetical protein
MKRLHWKLRVFAKSELLQNAALLTIIINTLFMAIDHSCDFCNLAYNCHTFKGALESANLGFAAIFLAEMLIKLAGIGVVKYLRAPMNWIDGLVVITSLVEIPSVVQTYECYFQHKDSCEEWYTCNDGGAALTVLRAFRYARFFLIVVYSE